MSHPIIFSSVILLGVICVAAQIVVFSHLEGVGIRGLVQDRLGCPHELEESIGKAEQLDQVVEETEDKETIVHNTTCSRVGKSSRNIDNGIEKLKDALCKKPFKLSLVSSQKMDKLEDQKSDYRNTYNKIKQSKDLMPHFLVLRFEALLKPDEYNKALEQGSQSKIECELGEVKRIVKLCIKYNSAYRDTENKQEQLKEKQILEKVPEPKSDDYKKLDISTFMNTKDQVNDNHWLVNKQYEKENPSNNKVVSLKFNNANNNYNDNNTSHNDEKVPENGRK